MSIQVGGGEPCKHGVVITQAVCDLCCLEDEIARLKRGEFTAEEIHGICHNFPMTVGARAFADGCAAEQRRLYGCAPDADIVAALTADLAQAQRERDAAVEARAHMRAVKQENAEDGERSWKMAAEFAEQRAAVNLKRAEAAEQQLVTLRAALQSIVEEMGTNHNGPRGFTPNARVFDWRDRLAALGGQP